MNEGEETLSRMRSFNRPPWSLLTLLAVVLAGLPACSGYRSVVQPRIAVSEEYTDNVRLREVGAESAVISTVSPGITYGLSGKNQDLSLSYDPSFAYYSEEDEHLTTRHAVALQGKNQWDKHSRVEIRENFMHTDDPAPLYDPSFVLSDIPLPEPDTTVRKSREPYSTNDVTTRVRHDFGKQDWVYFDYRFSLLNNEDPTVENNTRHAPAMGVTYWLTPEYGTETTAKFTRGDFSLETESLNEYYLSSKWMRRISHDLDVFVKYAVTSDDYQGQKTDYIVYDATAGFDYHLDESTFMTLSAGYFYQDVDQGDSDSGYVIRGDMAKKFRRGSIRLSGGAGYDQALFGAENLGFTKFYAANVAGKYQLTKLVTGEARADYRISKYPDVGAREDTLTSASGGLDYLCQPWLRLGFRVAHRKIDSTEIGKSYDENRISFSLTMAPPRPYPLEWEALGEWADWL